MSLIKTITEFKKYISLPGNVTIDTLLFAVPDAEEKYIRPFLGSALFDLLDEWYNAEDPAEDEAYTTLLTYVQRPLARFTIFLASPELDVKLSDSGIGVISNQNLAPASKDRVAKFDASNEQRGWDNIETLLKFLEANKDDYDEWVESGAYTMAIHNLVNTAEEFNKIYNIGESRLFFYRVRHIMDDVDNLKIKAAISAQQFDAILDEITSGETTDATDAILDNLKKAEVYFTIVESMDKSKYDGIGVEINNRLDFENYTRKAEQYLMAARTVMDKNHANYPEYEASDMFMDFEDDEVDYKSFDNTADDSKIFVAHGG